MTYHCVCSWSSTTGATGGAPKFIPSFNGVRVVRSLVFCVMFCRSLFVLFSLTIVLSVLQFTDSDYPFGFFKLCLQQFLVRTIFVLVRRKYVVPLWVFASIVFAILFQIKKMNCCLPLYRSSSSKHTSCLWSPPQLNFLFVISIPLSFLFVICTPIKLPVCDLHPH